MATPAMLIRAVERLQVNIGQAYFFHSEKEETYYVPLDRVEVHGDVCFVIKLSPSDRKVLLHSEIVDVQFV